jgi:hypothetical protein
MKPAAPVAIKFRDMRRLLFALAAFLLPGLAHAENYSDMWFNPAESGWGVTIADHETQLFAVWYTYEADGSPSWFTVPGGTFNANRTVFTGDLYRTTGPSYTGAFNPAAVATTRVGSASFHFTPGGAATFTWTIGAITRTKQIQRLPFGDAAPKWGVDRTDLWWNPAEAGWGLTIAQHGNNMFGAWFTYAPSGQPLFIVMPGVQQQSVDTFTGALYTTTGPGYTSATFDPAQVRVTQVGSATLRFNGDTATFTATVNGHTQTKTLSRQPFGGPTAPPAPPPTLHNRVEENVGVTFSGPWTQSSATFGWSGGSAMQSSTAGATATITFTGTSIRWLGARGRKMGIALVSVDGGPPREVSTMGKPNDIIHTPIVTIDGLSPGQHTLTITVAGRHEPQADPGDIVVVDAFEIDPGTTVSHWQDTNPGIQYSGPWTKSSVHLPYSGSGVQNVPELAVTAQESETAGATVAVPFRGTGISWIGYRGPDAGIATVRVDSGAPMEIDLYHPIATYQPIVFTAQGLPDTNHTLTITATGRKNPASTGARVVADAWDIYTPGRRYEEYDPSIVYTHVNGIWWTPRNPSRVWSEGGSATHNKAGATATFTFTGTSVSWIGCRKGSASGTVHVYIDDVFQQRIYLGENYPIEGYQMTVYRKDGLPHGQHTLKIEVVSNSGYVVVDAFDVR